MGIALLFPLIWLVRVPNLYLRNIGCVVAAVAVAAAFLTLYEFGGRRWVLHFSGSILFFLVAVPWPSIIERNTTSFLMPVNAAATLEALHWLRIPAIRSGNLLTLREGTLGVEEACSGIRSLQTTLMMAFFLGELNRLHLTSRCLLLALGILFALFTNILRTIALGTIAARQGLTATHHWHDTAGFLALGANVLCLFALTAYLLKHRPPTPAKAKVHNPFKIPFSQTGNHEPRTRNEEPGSTNPERVPTKHQLNARRAFLTPSSLLYFSLAFTFPFTEWWYARNERNPPPPWHLALPVEAPGFHRQVIDRSTASILRNPIGWSARWNSSEGKSVQGYYFEWAPEMISSWEISQFHHPANCLGAVGMQLDKEVEPISVPFAGGILEAKVMKFSNEHQTLHVLHLARENNHAGPLGDSAHYFMEPVLAGRRNGGLRVIEVGIWDETSEEAVRKEFTSLLKSSVIERPWSGG
jgi:exosortase